MNIQTARGLLMVIQAPDGLNRPYTDNRHYFISAPIRVLVFADRVEISNPGHLPNHLTVEQIRYGLSNLRNPLLASHATHLLPYRGLGSGIPRAFKTSPSIELVADRASNQFKAIIPRPVAG